MDRKDVIRFNRLGEIYCHKSNVHRRRADFPFDTNRSFYQQIRKREDYTYVGSFPMDMNSKDLEGFDNFDFHVIRATTRRISSEIAHTSIHFF